MYEQPYYYNGHSRWNLGWQSPNYSGIFLVLLLCFLWGWSEKSGRKWMVFGLECLLVYALCHTYSRGALVALAAAGWFYLLATRRTAGRLDARLWAARLGALAVALLATGFVSRIGPKVAADPSVTNRAELWLGSLQALAGSPIAGWGRGTSGRIYCDWFQNIDVTIPYITTVNSYLHIAVEYGGIALCVVLALIILLINQAIVQVRLGQSWLDAPCGACIVAWVTANGFTTLWQEPRLWILPSAAVGVVGLNGLQAGIFRPVWALRAAGASLLLVAGLITTGRLLMGAGETSITADKHGNVVLLRQNEGEKLPPDILDVWPDSRVLGPFPGKEIRRWVEGSNNNFRIVVHREYTPRGTHADATSSRIVLFGREVDRLFDQGFAKDGAEIWLINPLMPSRELSKLVVPSGGRIVVILSEMDETGDHLLWRRWAVALGAKIIDAKGVATDIRGVWPDVVLRVRPNKAVKDQHEGR